MTTKAERTEAIEKLRTWVKPGDTVYTILRHVSRSGMQRHISVVLLSTSKDGQIIDLHPNYSVAAAVGYRLVTGSRDALVVNGTGMDMGFDIVYNLSRVLFPEYRCIGSRRGTKGCPSNTHINSGPDRDKYGPNVIHHDGYALSHRWL